MIRDELQRLKTDPRTLRRFGLGVGAALVALGGLCLKLHPPACAWLLAAGGLLGATGAAMPRRLRRVYLAWMALALVLGVIMSGVLLTLLFYLVVTPLGLVARLCGRDFLDGKPQPQADSYWRTRDSERPKPPGDYERQF